MLKAIVDFIVPGSPARSTMCPSGIPPSIFSSKPWMNVRMRCPWPIVTHSMLDGARITVPRPLSAREGVRLQEKAKKKGGVIANSHATAGRRPPEAVSAPHLLERTARMRIRGGGRCAARPARGTRRGPPGPGQARSAAANERARVRDPRAAQRNPGRDSVRPDRQAVRDGSARPGDETDEAHGAVKGARPSRWMLSSDAG